MDAAVRRFRRSPVRPTVILPDASFEVVSVLEEHRIDFPESDHPVLAEALLSGRPGGGGVRRYIGEVNDSELASPAFARLQARASSWASRGWRSSTRASCAAARGAGSWRWMRAAAWCARWGRARTCAPQRARPLYTNIDLDLQKYIAQLFGDSLSGGRGGDRSPARAACSRCTAAPSWSIPTDSSAAFPSRITSRCSPTRGRPLYNKAIAGHLPAGIHVEARHRRHRAARTVW